MSKREMIDALILWRLRGLLPSVADVVNSLSVEGLPHEETPKEREAAVRAFRGLRQDQRFTHVRRVLEAQASKRKSRTGKGAP